MWLKLAITAVVIWLAWRLLSRKPGRARRLPKPADLVRCRRCGVHRLPGRPCDCDRLGRE